MKESPEGFISGSQVETRSGGRSSKRWMDCSVEEDLRRASVTKFTGKHLEDKE